MNHLFQEQYHSSFRHKDGDIDSLLAQSMEVLEQQIAKFDYENQYWGIFSGLAGAIYAHKVLSDNGFCKELDRSEAIEKINILLKHDKTVKKRPTEHSFIFGRLGTLFCKYLISKDQCDLKEILRITSHHDIIESHEICKGTPGFLYTLLKLAEISDAPEIEEQIKTLSNSIFEEMHFDKDLGHYIYLQDYCGVKKSYLGFIHGLSGNLHILERAFSKRDPEKHKIVIERSTQFLKAHDIHGKYYTCPVVIPSKNKTNLVQICHGPPGLIGSFIHAGKVEKNIHDTLIKCGETVQLAENSTKGSTICHGNAGNGLSILKLFELTQNQQYLNAAKVFAYNCEIDREDVGVYMGIGGTCLFLASLKLQKDITGVFL